MEKIISNIINIFIDIIISSISIFKKVYGHEYDNIELLKHYYVKLPYNKGINKYSYLGAEIIDNEKTFFFCCFEDFDTNKKNNGYVINLLELDKICKKYNIVFIPQIEKIDDGFLFISDIFYIKDKENKIKISVEDLINKYNKDFKEYFINRVNYQIILNNPEW